MQKWVIEMELSSRQINLEKDLERDTCTSEKEKDGERENKNVGGS